MSKLEGTVAWKISDWTRRLKREWNPFLRHTWLWDYKPYRRRRVFTRGCSGEQIVSESWDEHRTVFMIAAAVFMYKSTVSKWDYPPKPGWDLSSAPSVLCFMNEVLLYTFFFFFFFSVLTFIWALVISKPNPFDSFVEIVLETFCLVCFVAYVWTSVYNQHFTLPWHPEMPVTLLSFSPLLFLPNLSIILL